MNLHRISFEEIRKVIRLLTAWRLLEEDDWQVDPDDWGEQEQDILPDMIRYSIQEGETENDARARFLKRLGEVRWDMQLICFTADTVIRYACDLDSDTVAYHPAIAKFLEESKIEINPEALSHE